MFGLRVWKIVSGILSIILCFVVSYQTFFVQIGAILVGVGGISIIVGSFISIMLLVGGIVSIVTSKGSNGGDIALVIIFLLAALVGFLFAGIYGLWSIWCLICMFVALFSIALRQVDRGPYTPTKPAPAAPQKPTRLTMSEPLKKAVLEKNPQKQEAMVDNMSEEDAKNSLKYILRVITKKRK